MIALAAVLATGCSPNEMTGDAKSPTASSVDRQTATVEAPRPEAPKPAPKPIDDKDLVRKATVRQDSVDFTAPTGDKVTVKTSLRVDGDHFVVDVVINDKVIETIPTLAEKPGPDGFHHFEPKASVSSLANGILVVTATVKVTGKPDEQYDARVLAWNDTSKTLEVARKIAFEDAYDPAMDK